MILCLRSLDMSEFKCAISVTNTKTPKRCQYVSAPFEAKCYVLTDKTYCDNHLCQVSNCCNQIIYKDYFGSIIKKCAKHLCWFMDTYYDRSKSSFEPQPTNTAYCRADGIGDTQRCSKHSCPLCPKDEDIKYLDATNPHCSKHACNEFGCQKMSMPNTTKCIGHKNPICGNMYRNRWNRNTHVCPCPNRCIDGQNRCFDHLCSDCRRGRPDRCRCYYIR